MSIRTTYLGPAVSLRSIPSAPQVPHLYLDSNTTLQLDGARLKVGATNPASVTGIIYSTWTVDPASLAANVTSLLSQAVTGVAAGAVIVPTIGSSFSVNFNHNFYCESAGSVVYELGNVGGATQNLSTITVRIVAFNVST